MTDFKQKLAAIQHSQWSGWMGYLFKKCENPYEDGSLLIPKEYVKRWIRQMETEYKDLPENEKESDLIEAEKITRLIKDEIIGADEVIAVGFTSLYAEGRNSLRQVMRAKLEEK